MEGRYSKAKPMFYEPISSPGLSPSVESRARRRTRRSEAERAEAQRRARQARFAKLIDQFEADEIEAAVEGLIVMLDRREGDPDLEEGGDLELSGDEHGDPSWTEWHQRGGLGKRRGTETIGSPVAREDEEDDDPREANGDEEDTSFAEDEATRGDHGPGCPLSDPGEPGSVMEGHTNGVNFIADDDHEEGAAEIKARQPHRDRIRRRSCDRTVHRGEVYYDLRHGHRMIAMGVATDLLPAEVA